jgi:hypothetical protein
MKTFKLFAVSLFLASLSARVLAAEGPPTHAVAILHSTSGHQAHGIVHFIQEMRRVPGAITIRRGINTHYPARKIGTPEILETFSQMAKVRRTTS